jgi:3-hydroxymyristoyl/3-hydroxydecanoyl-(acyl carrier protein) dehydratase
LLHDHEEREGKLLYFTSIEKARFRRPVVPGDQVRYEVEVVHRRPRYAKLAGRVLVGETVAADAVITSAMVDR